MPVVFSPGEGETRPLDPTAIVYTTAQKVADFLGIGPQEPVAVSADSVADGVFITGEDYRRCGTEVGDSILIYSDANPLGVEKTITDIQNGGTSGVKLVFTGSFTHADFESADNTEVQNLASFTNAKVGRQRGVTKAIVETRIKEVQDKIDNITHNAWRPYLVSAEYINFDTYKPYRRRYYTDYVGTAPLLFRNVQQMLRIELWQGDDYREICGAEARLGIPADVRAISGSVVMSPGNGSAAILTAGTSSSQWRADFDATTTAQNLADLINKENRVSKSAVEFAPSFTLEGSTSNIAVHNEFFATANSDYGTGVVKISSMRPVKAGETCSIVCTDSNVSISQTQRNTDTISSTSGDFGSAATGVVTVADTDGFAKAGVFTDNTNVIRYTGVTPTTFTGCEAVVGSTPSGDITQHLLQVDLQGGSASGDNARLKDWWMDHEVGIIYFNNSYPFFEYNAIKVSYIYGERYVEQAIEEIATKMVVIDLLMSDDRSVLLPEGTSNVDLTAKIQLLQSEIERVLPRYREMVLFE
jgi:hypothetical protein|tara:strand:+ start:812 stop:2398 length:1587 start_codon:yes stop_codon:yes gene_type:complete